VNDLLLVRVMQSPCRLDRHVKNPLKRLGWAASIKPSMADPFLQSAPVNELRENDRGVVNPANIVARYGVRVQSQIHPRLTFLRKQFLRLGVTDRLTQGHLRRKIQTPSAVKHTVNAPHRALREMMLRMIGDRLDDISLEDHIVHSPVEARGAVGAKS
jgi:hypothetical protein